MQKDKAKKEPDTSVIDKKIEELSTQVSDLDVKLRSALADYQNLKKELEKQHEMQTAIVKKRVFSDLIDIFTDLFFALEQLPQDLQDNPNIHGITHIMSKYQDLLRNHGVTEIVFKEGDDYNSELAEVLGIVNHEEISGKVAQMIQPGYKIGDVMIRPARVMIYKKVNK